MGPSVPATSSMVAGIPEPSGDRIVCEGSTALRACVASHLQEPHDVDGLHPVGHAQPIERRPFARSFQEGEERHDDVVDAIRVVFNHCRPPSVPLRLVAARWSFRAAVATIWPTRCGVTRSSRLTASRVRP